MASAPYGQAAEFSILVSNVLDSSVSARGAEFVVLVSCGAPPSRYSEASEFAVLASTQKGKVMVDVSELAVLVSYVELGTERFTQRSWGFNFDQHQFYVLHLGAEGTFVFDVLSEQWAQWETQGFNQWNAEAGIEWNDEVYFGDNELPTLWKLNPDSFLDDDFRLIKRVVTGGIPADARGTLRTGMLVLSTEQQSAFDDESVPYVQLSISDDGGVTFNDREALTVDGSKTQDLSWRGLGMIRAPGRVFKITDEGAIVTIKGMDQRLAGEKESG